MGGEIARRCKVGYTLVAKLKDELEFDTARAGSMERTFIHPKTGQPTQMKTGRIGKKRPAGAVSKKPRLQGA